MTDELLSDAACPTLACRAAASSHSTSSFKAKREILKVEKTAKRLA